MTKLDAQYAQFERLDESGGKRAIQRTRSSLGIVHWLVNLIAFFGIFDAISRVVKVRYIT